jgi:predicted dehydrogenase
MSLQAVARKAAKAKTVPAAVAPVRVAVIGCGDWGKNLVREFYQSPQADLVSCCDTQDERLAGIQQAFPKIRGVTSAKPIFSDSSIEAVVIATPASTHAELTQQALEAGKHVFVEKPIALTPADAQRCIEVARTRRRRLMVGHLLRYHPAFLALKRVVDSGELGRVRYAYTQRLNLGRIRKDENALWSLAPHDVSMILELFGNLPVGVAARGACFVQEKVEDIIFVTLQFSDGRLAHIHLSWLDPHKIRKITVVGSQKMVTFDDMEPAEKLRIYDKGAIRDYDSYGDWWITLRSGDIQIPRVDLTEPLKLECQHFLECVRQDKVPLSDGEDGLRVLRVLDAAQRSLGQGGGWVTL